MIKVTTSRKHVIYSYLSTFFGILSNLIFLQYSSTTFYGKYGLLKNILGLLDYSHLGIRYGLDFEKNINQKASLLALSNSISLIVSILLISIFSHILSFTLIESTFLISSVFLIFFHNFRISKRVSEFENFVNLTFVLNILLAIIPISIIFLIDELVLIPLSCLNFALLLYLFTRKSLKFSFEKTFLKKMIIKYKNLFLIQVLSVIVILSDRTMISFFLEPKLADYTFASFIATVALVLPGSLWEAKLKDVVNSSYDKIKKLLKNFFGLNFVFVLSITFSIFFGLDFFVKFINDEYLGITTEVILVFISNFFLFSYYVLNYCQYSLNQINTNEVLFFIFIYFLLTWMLFPLVEYFYFLVIRFMIIFLFFAYKSLTIVLFSNK